MLFSPIKPMIVSIGKEAFDDDEFIFEPKWDGWRILLHKQGTRLEAFTRNGNVVTSKFPELKEAISSIKADTAILDCEGVCIRDGRSVFDDFSYRGRISDSAKIKAAVRTHPATFLAFDVLLTSSEHLREPLMTRKNLLNEIISSTDILTPTVYIEGRGKDLSSWSIEYDMEGIVAKRKNSKYVLGAETKDWLKIKNFKTIDTIILGYRTKPQFGLILGLHFKTVRYKPVGIVEFGFRVDDKRAFLEIAQQIQTRIDKKTYWIEPKLCCRIQYLERTDQHQLRTTIFKGFLFDKDPENCYWTY
ncbi:DNA ligase [Paenibacillus frigoriresistens]|uniref:ATP-dependent DNA ligase n=1 Tax=Paenibacillus alginolyticus TaxID=59839 RepID=UPI001563F9CC|nr:DNA ligase [Paenibacillus frigoriresistens]NRF89817.1 DNA ligase [Paenibacillus frigoriresistens]